MRASRFRYLNLADSGNALDSELMAHVLALQRLSLFLQGQNLTDEPFVSVDTGASIQIRNYQSYGRRFMAGFNYRF